MNQKTESLQFHSADAETVLQRLTSSLNGLSTAEAMDRQKQYGPNELPRPEKVSAIVRFLKQFNNPLIYVLLGSSAMTALLGDWLDTYIILGVVVINALIGFIQENKAEKALDGVRKMLSEHARVVRDGIRKEIPASEAVPGDIVILNAGDRVPADLRILKAEELHVNEASLTGESLTVKKSPEPVGTEAPLGDRTCMAYTGTLVTSGQGTGVITATGAGTELGKISRLLSEVKQLTTPIMRQMEKFGIQLTVIILSVSFITFLTGLFITGMELPEIFLAVVGIAVAAIPEGLPAILSITLAIGVQKMARRNAIIRHLPAVDTLGSVDIICSDKTGTLTKGEMTVTRIITEGAHYRLTGTGYEPEGEILHLDNPADIEDHPGLADLLEAGILCNDARLSFTGNTWKAEGSPTEAALISAAAKAGLSQSESHSRFERLRDVPFSSENKFMISVHPDFLIMKGAPERVILRSAGDRDFWLLEAEKLASEGYRVLAIARKELSPRERESFTDQNSIIASADGLNLLGLFGIMDPPRDEVIDAIEVSKGAGIRVKMITGDHALTAVSIGHMLKIGNGKDYLTGPDLEKISDEELVEKADSTDIFARVSPEHKLRIVTALQKKGYITAMTGDGVNDAPALKKSDIGIAMGIKGTEVSKDASVMVLADDNFASIANAIEEGRTVFDNIKKSLLFILPTNGAEALVIIAAIFFGFALPMTPAQILWVNMITQVTLALAIAFEPMERAVMKRPPRNSGESLVDNELLIRISFVAVLLTLSTTGLFFLALHNGASLELARTIAVNTLIWGEIFYLFNSRLIASHSVSLRSFLATRYVWIAVMIVALIQIPFSQWSFANTVFRTEAMSVSDWGLVLGVNAIVFFIIEAEKSVWRLIKK